MCRMMLNLLMNDERDRTSKRARSETTLSQAQPGELREAYDLDTTLGTMGTETTFDEGMG